MSLKHRAIALCAVGAVALGLSACGSNGSQPDETTTSNAEQPTREESASDPSNEASKSGEDGGEPNDAGGVMEVTVAGEQGVLALQYSGSVPDGAAGPTGRKLITGPGGCFALTNDGPPQLLVFPADATFVLQGGKPSVTVAGSETPVGRKFTADTIEVSKSSATGLPDRCSQGADDTLLVVN